MSPVEERALAISWLRTKLFAGEAGLDPHDSAVMIIEVAHEDRAWRVDQVGFKLISHPHRRRNGSWCTRVRCLIEADVRMELGLDDPGAPTLAQHGSHRSSRLERRAGAAR